jgi:RND family efflux transporter MFP subunit
VYIYFSVNERDVQHIRASALKRGVNITGAAPKVPVYVGLQTEPGYPHEGTLDFASTGLDTGSGTLQARAVFPNPERILLPGMFARLRVPTADPREELMVPDRAVASDQAGSYVLIVAPDHKVLQQRVEIGTVQDGMRVIRSGLDGATDVVIDGLQNAVPGNLVTPTTQTLTAAAAPDARP